MRVKNLLWSLLWICFADPALADDCSVAVRQGYELLSKGNNSQAVFAFSYAVRNEPQNILARKYLAVALQRSNMCAQAVQQMEVVNQQEPNNTANLALLAEMLRSNGENTKAITYFRRSLALFPGNDEAFCGLAKSYMATGDNSKALNTCLAGLKQSKQPRTRQELTRLMQELSSSESTSSNADARG
jgi:Flp pilus assembly protein TadD